MEDQARIEASAEALEADEPEGDLGDAKETKGQSLMDWYGQD
jgi:hypothetical protein